MYIATSIKNAVGMIDGDGLESFRIHLNNFADDFRGTDDPEALIAEKPETDDRKIYCLAAATVSFLCREREIQPPEWVKNRNTILEKPWFPSGVLNWRAMELRDAPSAFKFRNIFVGRDVFARV